MVGGTGVLTCSEPRKKPENKTLSGYHKNKNKRLKKGISAQKFVGKAVVRTGGGGAKHFKRSGNYGKVGPTGPLKPKPSGIQDPSREHQKKRGHGSQKVGAGKKPPAMDGKGWKRKVHQTCPGAPNCFTYWPQGGVGQRKRGDPGSASIHGKTKTGPKKKKRPQKS